MTVASEVQSRGVRLPKYRFQWKNGGDGDSSDGNDGMDIVHSMVYHYHGLPAGFGIYDEDDDDDEGEEEDDEDDEDGEEEEDEEEDDEGDADDGHGGTAE